MRCNIQTCTVKYASFAINKESKERYCSMHKKNGMIDVINKKCEFKGCRARPSFNFEEQKKAIRCGKHKETGMINVNHKKCEFDDCPKIPKFNFKDKKKAIRCGKHKENGMINVINKKCEFKGCRSHPNFNFEDKKKPLYCSKHKENGMIDIKHKKCEFKDCNTQPYYNFEEQKKAIRCGKHKENGMIDVKNKRCISEKCIYQPYYNFEDQKKPLYCSKHKENGMIDVINKRCPICGTFVGNKYKGYCVVCFMHLFPDEPVSRNYRTKEKTVVDFVQTEFKEFNYDWIYNKRIQNGCSSRRPDLLLDLGYQVLIVEIDENQHREYDCSCENKRTAQIYQDVGHRPLIFIRFNPDEYNNKYGKNITGCFGLGKDGILRIKKTKQKEWIDRLNVLKEQIQYWIDNKSDKAIQVIELFFDVK